jgi:hypothetical protein
VLQCGCGIAGVVVAHHTRGVLAFLTATEDQHVRLAQSVSHTNELATWLLHCLPNTTVLHNHALDHVLTVYASAGLGFILDLFVLIGLNEVFRDDVTELARMKKCTPFGRIVVLKLECLVEHFPYACRTDWATFDVGASVVAEVHTTYLAVPKGSHRESKVGGVEVSPCKMRMLRRDTGQPPSRVTPQIVSSRRPALKSRGHRH